MMAFGRPVLKAEPTPDPHWEYVYRLDREFQDQWEAGFNAGFAAWRKTAKTSELAAAIEIGDPSLLRETVEINQQTIEALRGWQAPVTAVFGRAAKAELARMNFKLNFRLDNPYAVRWIEQHTADLVTAVTEESRRAIQTIVLEGFQQHAPPRRFAIRIREWIGLTERQMKSATNYWLRLNESAVRSARGADEMADTYAHRLLRQRALTIARTETIAAAAGGTQASFIAARDAGLVAPGTKRVWIAAAGSRRTCPICMGLNDQQAAMDEPFQSRYDGSYHFLPPAHVSCRCSIGLETAIPAQAQPEAAPAPRVRPERQPKPSMTLADRVQARIQQGTATPQDLQQIGAMLTEEPLQRYGQLRSEVAALRSAETAAVQESDRLAAMGKAAEAERRYEDVRRLRKQRLDAQDRINTLGDDVLQNLQQVRPMGDKNNRIKQPWTDSTPDGVKTAFKKIRRYLPDDWLQESATTPLRGELASRGYWDDRQNVLAVTRGTERRDASTLHEFGHRVESMRKSTVQARTREFLQSRTRGEKAQAMGAGYRPDEKTKRDRFLDPYMGKQYDDATEILSMGLEKLFQPTSVTASLVDDPGYLQFIVGVLAAL